LRNKKKNKIFFLKNFHRHDIHAKKINRLFYFTLWFIIFKKYRMIKEFKTGTNPVIPFEYLQALVVKAGNAILAIYNDEDRMKQVTFKKDDSPVTLADRASHEIIVRGLHALTPDIPVLSEEGTATPYAIRRHWENFWCVDPLDGTKEFIRKNDEFTINIALIHKQEPILGIIFVPVSQTLYCGWPQSGSWKIHKGDAAIRIHADNQAQEWIAVGSRSHASPEEEEIVAKYPVTKKIFAGSALKFCLIAEGAAHFYYRHGPTMEWDTAAGHAIVQYSGGKLSMPSGEPFLYNKESLVNGSFICSIDRTT
jgi:3'(2'), 5'-bisphosphate nucleotidase